MVINQINLDPAEWENETAIVIGKLSGPFAYPTAISYGFVLSSNKIVTLQTNLDVNSIGIDFRNGGAQLSGSTVLIIDIVEKGINRNKCSGRKTYNYILH